MPDKHSTLKQQFEQLPDVEPPFGMDTRIKAQAKAEVERQVAQRERRRRWGAGAATAACAVLAVVIARPLLQQPLNHSEDLNNFQLNESADAAVEPMESVVESLDSIKEISSGGGAEPQSRPRASSPAKQLNTQRAPAPAMSRAAKSADAVLDNDTREELGLSIQSLANTAAKIPALDDLLDQLEQHQNNGNKEKQEQTLELIKRHYPEHKMH